ncbi:MAG: shikimate dehydrogenase [Acetobacteraceae bacterium]|nr:shikimate dehydrogenase [Acetobacteraceae bacterium]MSP29484.1 shikimate dehydrogenase [Acetobacteraceae bacterium]
MPILSGTSRLAGIIGWPVAHSRSPRLHGFWLRRHGIDGAYAPLAIRPEDFVTGIRGLVAMGFQGANVTQPHKLAAFDICDIVEASARRAGAVNTLTFRDGKITGRNTDGWGFIAHLRASGIQPKAGPALVLGAGGSARAIVTALQDEGVPVALANRTSARADELAALLPGLKILDWNHRSAALADHSLLVNATSLGMASHEPLAIDLDRGSASLAVADIVYVPLQTPLLTAAHSRGLRTMDGLGMLLHQAVPGFTEWFGTTPVVDEELRRFVASDLIEAT